jgi:rod shape-determining protein MreC
VGVLALLKRYRELLLLLVLLVFPLVTYFAHAKRPSELSRVDRVILMTTGPVEKAIGWAITGVLRTWNGYVALRHSHERAMDLTRQVIGLQVQQQELLQLKEENDRLRRLLGVSEAAPERRYLGARVVGVRLDPKGLQVLTLDRGSSDGVAKMMPVVVAQGVVGRIQNVLPGLSEILLLTDRNSSVATRVERSRARANVRGLNRTDVCALDYALRSEDMIEGDLLVTSGTDGIFPRGLPVGKITNVKRNGRGLYQAADVVPAVEVTRLEEVLIITSAIGPPGATLPSAQYQRQEAVK